ncbi:MAG TPA: AAA family ATPase [Nitriliruptorales bacterium]
MLLILSEGTEFAALAQDFTPDSHRTVVVTDASALDASVREYGHELESVIIGPDIEEEEALDAAAEVHARYPHLAVILVRERAGARLLRAAMRTGVHEVLSGYVDRDSYLQALESAMAETALHRERGVQPVHEGAPLGRIVTVFSSKGGCGKSTVATNLAMLLARHAPGDVALVDLDLQSGDVAVLMQLLPQWTSHDAAVHAATLDADQLVGFMTKHEEGVDVLAAPLQPEHGDALSAELTTKILQLLRSRYRYVVIDGPAYFTDPLLAALDESDLIVVLASLDVPSVRGLRTTLHTMEQLQVPASRIRRVLNRADSKVGLTVREVERSIGAVVDVAIPSSRDVPRSVNQGTPLALTDPGSPVVQAIDEIRRLVLPDTAGDHRAGRRRGLLRLPQPGGE